MKVMHKLLVGVAIFVAGLGVWRCGNTAGPQLAQSPAPTPAGVTTRVVARYLTPNPKVPVYAVGQPSSPPAAITTQGNGPNTKISASSNAVSSNPNVYWFKAYSSPTTTFWFALDTTYIYQGTHTGSYVESIYADTSVGQTGKYEVFAVICAENYLTPGCQTVNDSTIVLECPRTADNDTHCPSGPATYDSTFYMDGVNTSKIPSGDQLWLAAGSFIQAKGVNPDGTMVYEYYGNGPFAIVNVWLHQSDISTDASGAIQYTACSTHCAFGSKVTSPTNVTISNAVQYYKVTWANNGDTVDSAEVWGGIEGQETKQGVFGTSVTQLFGSWVGHGIYDAYVFHRYNGVVSATVYSSGSITH